MGQVTPNMSIYIPAAGETNYDASFLAGMINVDQHDHSGPPDNGVPIASSGIADGSVTFSKLNANVADNATGIGTETGSNANKLTLLGVLSSLYQSTSSGFAVKNGNGPTGTALVRTITGTSGQITVTNGDGIAANPQIGIAAAFMSSVVLQSVNASTTSTVNITNPFPYNSSARTNTDGTQVLTATITPKSASSNILVLVNLQLAVRTGGTPSNPISGGGVFRDAITNALAAQALFLGDGGNGSMNMQFMVASGSTSPTTFNVRAGPSVNTYTLYLNGDDTGTIYGGELTSTLTLIEFGG
jgi:hypothetical protein